MNRNPRFAQPVTAGQLGQMAEELETLAKTLRNCQKTAESQPGQILAIYYWVSAETGLSRMSSFVRSADESRRAAAIGRPLKPGEPKPRSTALEVKPNKVAETNTDYNG